MKRCIRTVSMTLVMAGLALTQAPRSAQANDDDKNKKNLIVTVAFGASFHGGNQASARHLVLPQRIHVRAGGVVNFVVGGIHEIFIYRPGTTPEDVLLHAPPFPGSTFASNFINYGILPTGIPDDTILFYVGVNPAHPQFLMGANPARPPNPPARSNHQNRVEAVHFPEPGTYLLICNINPHFRSGMWAFVEVMDNDDGEKD